jgi:hypothetical protein
MDPSNRGGRCGRGRMVPVQSVSITIKAVTSNPAHSEMYSIPHYVIIVRQ